MGKPNTGKYGHPISRGEARRLSGGHIFDRQPLARDTELHVAGGDIKVHGYRRDVEQLLGLRRT